MSYFHNADVKGINATHKLKVDDLEGKLASINRRLAGGDYLNVAKLVVPRGEASRIPSSDRFFVEDGFYAAMPSQWTYAAMKDTDLANAVYGEEGDKQPNKLTSLASLHVWRRGDFVNLGGNGLINHIAPLITVQRLPNKQLKEVLGIDDTTLQAWKSDRRSSLEQPTDDDSELKKSLAELGLRTVFQGDIVGAYLTQNFSLVFDQLRSVKGIDANLVTINKVNNVLYCQVLITLENGTLADVKFDRYYLSLESIVISTRENLYVINMAVPRADPAPRGTVAAEVTQWLNDFAIPE